MRQWALFVVLLVPFHLLAQTPTCLPPGPRIALTFDDGPWGDHTSRILDTLKQHGAQATFFLVGRQVAHHEGLVLRELDEGHEIGIHTWSHKDLAKSSRATRVREITQGFNAVQNAAPHAHIAWWRAPYGSGARLGQGIADEFGLKHRLWDVDTLDWTGSAAEVLLVRVLDHVHDGDVVLMHDHGRHTIEALDPMLVALEHRGYRMVTVSQLRAPVCPPPIPEPTPVPVPDEPTVSEPLSAQ